MKLCTLKDKALKLIKEKHNKEIPANEPLEIAFEIANQESK